MNISVESLQQTDARLVSAERSQHDLVDLPLLARE